MIETAQLHVRLGDVVLQSSCTTSTSQLARGAALKQGND
jgi:hypothetical protein